MYDLAPFARDIRDGNLGVGADVDGDVLWTKTILNSGEEGVQPFNVFLTLTSTVTIVPSNGPS